MSESEELWPDNPHSVPHIECEKCGHGNHIDVTSGEFQGRCVKCSGFLRRPTQDEFEEFWDFMDWNAQQLETETDPEDPTR